MTRQWMFRSPLHRKNTDISAVNLTLPFGVGGTCAEVIRNLNITAANLFCKVKLYITAGLVYGRKYRTPYAYIGIVPPAVWIFRTGDTLVGKKFYRRIYGIVVGKCSQNNFILNHIKSR